MEKFNKKQMKILEDYFDVHEDDTTIELESWTNGGVNMIIYINKKDHFGNDYLTQLKEFVDNFNIDEEIDLHRESEQYCNDFTITESVEDFTEYINEIKEIVNKLQDAEQGETKMTTKYYIEFVDKNECCDFVMQSKWFLTETDAIQWLIADFDHIDLEKFSIFVMSADFDDEGDFGDIELSKEITEHEYLKLRKNYLEKSNK